MTLPLVDRGSFGGLGVRFVHVRLETAGQIERELSNILCTDMRPSSLHVLTLTGKTYGLRRSVLIDVLDIDGE